MTKNKEKTKIVSKKKDNSAKNIMIMQTSGVAE